MTVEERVKMLVGDLMVSLQMAQATIEELKQKVAELEARQGNVENLHERHRSRAE